MGHDDLFRYAISTHAPHARRGYLVHYYLQVFFYFYSRASCEARRFTVLYNLINIDISTHAPHARRGLLGVKLHLLTGKFLLTRLMRGAASEAIFLIAPSENFYSRASCEARHT